jgi:endonuclease/exonuclease/phosphatase family metal-dependent hydrolase
MLKKALAVLVAVVGLAMATPAGASSGPVRSASYSPYYGLRVEVMSQNLYIGADLDRLLEGEPPAAILDTILQTNYPARAVEIAQGIDDFNPDLIGLQEVWSLTVFDSQGNTLLSQDYLDILLKALEAEGEHYEVSSVSTNADVTLPLDPEAGTFARVVDRDVILHRPGSVTVSNEFATNFDNNLTVELGGFPLEFTRGYHAVDAQVGSKKFRFVNTHLEVENAPCFSDKEVFLGVCQELQAEQLANDLADESKQVILVGDFNAQPGEPTYNTIVNAGYKDTWNSTYEEGFTCCQAETLDNVESLLDRRIDHIFVERKGLYWLYARTTVVGDWEERKTPDGLWYSDHGGPWARLWLGLS